MFRIANSFSLVAAALWLATLVPSPSVAAPSVDAAKGFVNLYFSAPLLSEKLQRSETWKRHSGLGSQQAQSLMQSVWEAYRTGQQKETAKAYRERLLVVGEDRLHFTVSRQGETKPGKKLPVTISLHGGGTQSREQNDRQWLAQQKRYPKAPGIYVCPRAPRDTWDQWQAVYVRQVISALINEILVHEDDADPERIYLMGYSAGAYGAFRLGSRLSERFAAVAASAGGPTPDATPVEHWQHLPLRIEIGEEDVAYGRIKHCRNYESALRQLRDSQVGDKTFNYTYIEHSRRGHQIDDRASALWLGQHQRVNRPKALTWTLSDSSDHHHYWLGLDEPQPGQRVQATIEGNTIRLETAQVERLRVRLDDQLLDLDEPVTVFANGMKIFEGPVRRDLRCLVETLEERGDPGMMFCSEIALYIP